MLAGDLVKSVHVHVFYQSILFVRLCGVYTKVAYVTPQMAKTTQDYVVYYSLVVMEFHRYIKYGVILFAKLDYFGQLNRM